MVWESIRAHNCGAGLFKNSHFEYIQKSYNSLANITFQPKTKKWFVKASGPMIVGPDFLKFTFWIYSKILQDPSLYNISMIN